MSYSRSEYEYFGPGPDFYAEWRWYVREIAAHYGWRRALDYCSTVLRWVTTPEWFIATCVEYMPRVVSRNYDKFGFSASFEFEREPRSFVRWPEQSR